MGASILIKTAMLHKGMKVGDLAPLIGFTPQALSVKLNRDTMTFESAEKMADALGCDIVLRDRETGKIYG